VRDVSISSEDVGNRYLLAIEMEESMRKIIVATSTLIPVLMLATTLAAQAPVTPQESPGAVPAAGASPKDPIAQPPESGGAQRAPNASGGVQAQGKEMPVNRQQTGSSSPGTETQKKQPQAAQGVDPSDSPRDAQNRAPDPATGQNTQRSATPAAQNEQTTEGGATTKQRAGTNQNIDTQTTGSVSINSEKRTTIRETITRERVSPIRDVNFSVNVGVAVPRTVELRPLPPRVIEIVPQYRSYRFFLLADGRIVIVEPDTYKIVYIITA